MEFLERFLAGEVAPQDFPHADHVRAGYALLCAHDFLGAATVYSAALKKITARAGKPEVFHQTITLAFLALIAERMEQGPARDFQSFADANPDLMGKAALARWYSPEKLQAPFARRSFALPDRAP